MMTTRAASKVARLCGAAALAAAALAGCALHVPAPVDYEAVIAQADRSEADRKTDQRRKPAQILAFTGLRPGMRVMDLAAGGGYSTELVARTVGPTGVVYGQNSTELGEGASLTDVMSERRPGETVRLLVRRGKQEFEKSVELIGDDSTSSLAPEEQRTLTPVSAA